MGMTSKVEKLFDISQTTAADRNVTRPVYRSAADLLMECSPQAIEKPELPDEAYALYDSQTNEIHVKQGLDPDTKFFVIAREQAVAIDESRIEILVDDDQGIISIRDNGTGIPQANVRATLLDIGNSTKLHTVNRGFRGIGRLGGLSYCKSLSFCTTAKGEDNG